MLQVEGTCVVYRSTKSFSIAVWTDWRVADADDGASIATSADSARSRRRDTLVIIIFVCFYEQALLLPILAASCFADHAIGVCNKL